MNENIGEIDLEKYGFKFNESSQSYTPQTIKENITTNLVQIWYKFGTNLVQICTSFNEYCNKQRNHKKN